MRRYFLILVLLILPVQFSWAAAARYCQHETASAPWHPGHHEHRHQTAESKPDFEKKSVLDTDCGVCHIVSAPFMFGQILDLTDTPRVEHAHSHHTSNFTSLNPRAPDRPQWRGLA